MATEHQSTLTLDEVRDIKAAMSNLAIVPTAVVFFVPHTIIWSGHSIGVFFFFGTVEISIAPWNLYFEMYHFLGSLLILFAPALAVSIVLSWMLRRLSTKKTTYTRVLQATIGATICWAIYLSIFFFGNLSIGFLSFGPIPIAIGPIVAVLCAKSIMKMADQIDAIDSSVL